MLLEFLIGEDASQKAAFLANRISASWTFPTPLNLSPPPQPSNEHFAFGRQLGNKSLKGTEI